MWQGGDQNQFHLYRNTAFQIVAKPEGGFISNFDDDYSDDPALAPFNELSHETATQDEAVTFWVNTIREAQTASNAPTFI